MKITTDLRWESRPHRSYVAIFATLTTSGGTIALEGPEVSGKNFQAKQTALHQAAEHRGLKIDTRTVGDQIYVRLRPEVGR